MVFVSIIIPIYHDWVRLALCVEALKKQTYPKHYFEIIIVNNDPEDPIPNSFCNLDNIVLLNEAKHGSYAARNSGIRAAKGEILAFTDSDCIPLENWVEAAASLLCNGSERVAGKIQIFGSSKKLNFAEAYDKIYAFDQKSNAYKGASVTANMITWAKNFDLVGLFNEKLFSGGDTEWGLRAYKQGINITYSENVIVKHPARKSVRELLMKARRVAGGVVAVSFSKGKTFSKHEQVILAVRALVPPLRGVKKIIRNNETTFVEKCAAYIVSYYMKIMSCYYRIRLINGWDKPQRI
tara:strand:- start:1724 stop:2608 length:885 start_codon:yes stop_codon:yes gene_type:complete